jgi:hypothetical protein
MFGEGIRVRAAPDHRRGLGLIPCRPDRQPCGQGASQLDARRAANEAAWYAAQAAGFQGELPDDPFTQPGASGGQSGYSAAFAAEQQAQADLLREIFGPLSHRPVPVAPEWLGWQSGLVPNLAQQIYDASAFEDLPVGHVRGCWVVDLILSKDR